MLPVRRRVHPFVFVVGAAILCWAGIGALLISWGL